MFFQCLINAVKYVIVTSIVYAIALFYGWVTLISVSIKWFRTGNKFWYVKERTLPPRCLNDISYGRHAFIQLQVDTYFLNNLYCLVIICGKFQDIRLHYVENGDRSKPLMLLVHGFPEFWFTWRKQLQHFSKTHWYLLQETPIF